MADRKLAGQIERLQLRRIGERHAVYTPERVSKTVDVNKLRVQHGQQLEQIAKGVAQLEQMRAAADSTKTLLDAFDAQSIDRVDGDPDVPLEALPAPEPERALAPDPAPVKAAPTKRRG